MLTNSILRSQSPRFGLLITLVCILLLAPASATLAANAHHRKHTSARHQVRRSRKVGTRRHSRHTTRRARRVTRVTAKPTAKPTPSSPTAAKPVSSTSVFAAPITTTPVLSNSVAPRLFAPDNVSEQSLANDAPLDPSSAAMVNGLVTEVAREVALNIGPWISGTSHVYTVGPDTPTVRVQLDDPTLAWRASLQTAFAAVPIPAGAVPEAGSDSEMSIWQPSTDKLWEFFEMRLLPDGWHAAWGGAMQNVLAEPRVLHGATRGRAPHRIGGRQPRACHMPPVSSPRPTFSRARSIMPWRSTSDTRGPAYGLGRLSAPTGQGPIRTRSPGAHLRLDPNLNLAALHLPPLVYMMAKAAQKYGMIVRDQTHWAIGFSSRTPRSPVALRTGSTARSPRPACSRASSRAS